MNVGEFLWGHRNNYGFHKISDDDIGPITISGRLAQRLLVGATKENLGVHLRGEIYFLAAHETPTFPEGLTVNPTIAVADDFAIIVMGLLFEFTVRAKDRRRQP